MILALDPTLPVVWRSPTSLQIGIDRPAVVVTGVTTADELMISALQLGVSRSGLLMIGQSSGASAEDIAALLTSVAPALTATTDPPSHTERRVVVDGDSSCRALVRSALAAAGLTLVSAPTRMSEDRAAASVDLAVVVARYAVTPAAYGYWMRRDIPLLPVVFSDTRVFVGPLVVPGIGSCLHCMDRHRVEADTAWPAIASQLVGRASPLETPLVGGEAATVVTRAAHDWLTHGRNTLADSAIALDADTGRLSRRGWPPHPECGCRALPGTVTPSARPTGGRRTRSRRAGALAEPA